MVNTIRLIRNINKPDIRKFINAYSSIATNLYKEDVSDLAQQKIKNEFPIGGYSYKIGKLEELIDRSNHKHMKLLEFANFLVQKSNEKKEYQTFRTRLTIAGGSIASVLFYHIHKETFDFNDVDLYLFNSSLQDVDTPNLKKVLKDLKGFTVNKDSAYVNWVMKDYNIEAAQENFKSYLYEFDCLGLPGQYITKYSLSSNPASFVFGFDLGICCCYLDLKDMCIYASKLCLSSIRNRFICTNKPFWVNPTSTFLRFLKYSKRAKWSTKNNITLKILLHEMEVYKAVGKVNILNKYIPYKKLIDEGLLDLVEKFLILNNTIGLMQSAIPWDPKQDATFVLRDDAYQVDLF